MEEGGRLGVDIGGTFTDVALEAGGRRYSAKILTTPEAPERAVLEAIGTVLREAALAPADLSIIIHGTTLATNAIIERKGAKTALLTTEGFRDTIEIRHENRFEQYDVNIDLPPPLVPRRLRFPVRERIDARGRVLVPLDEAGVSSLADRLAAAGVQSVAIGFLHSFTNPAHERRAGEILADRLPGVPITLSSDVSPEMREYERFSTACANAYVQPLIGRYLADLEAMLRREGFVCPLFLMLSGGGLTSVETAIRFPVRLVESGPAGGAIFAAEIARQCRLDKVLSYDMGGTTAKICLIDDLKPQTNRAFEVARIYRFKKGSGLPLRIPVIEMVEIGAGGGSIARVDRLKRITVGPDSAGADPGPACYGRGGARADRDRCGSAARPHRSDRLFRRAHGARPRRGRDGDAAGGGRAAGAGGRARRARGQRDRRREHGERRARPRDRERQGRARPHPRRVWRRRAVARRAHGRKIGARPRAGAVLCRRRLRGRLSARADRLRDRALLIAAPR